MNWQEVESSIKTGAIAQRNIWPPCKKIRKYTDADADFFNNEFDTENAIVCECDKPCDCKVGIWVPDAGDKDATDWHLIK